ncbi:hypothetical protein HY639_05780 [Candidatus Woesearchaeota archaeon]|nr:hypothetical protein [Candidatus Woesearchaeota archaeon]
MKLYLIVFALVLLGCAVAPQKPLTPEQPETPSAEEPVLPPPPPVGEIGQREQPQEKSGETQPEKTRPSDEQPSSPANACSRDADCKLLYSSCSCIAVPKTDTRTFDNSDPRICVRNSCAGLLIAACSEGACQTKILK